MVGKAKRMKGRERGGRGGDSKKEESEKGWRRRIGEYVLE